jgi:AraC-type DNA-binding domain-containing proteins
MGIDGYKPPLQGTMTDNLAETKCLALDRAQAIRLMIDGSERSAASFQESGQVLFMLNGWSDFECCRQAISVRQGEMMITRGGSAMRFATHNSSDSSPNRALVFSIREHLIRDFARKAEISISSGEDSMPISVRPMDARQRCYVESVLSLFEGPAGQDRGLVELKIMELLHILACGDAEALSGMVAPPGEARAGIRAAVEAHLRDRVTLNDLADLSGVSLSTFKRKFQDEYGEPPARWLRNWKLERARTLLERPDYSVMDACVSTGFENLSVFSRAFKRRFGISPSEARVLATPRLDVARRLEPKCKAVWTTLHTG